MSKKSFLSTLKGYSNIEIPRPMSFFWTISLSSLRGIVLSCHLVLIILISSDNNEEDADGSYIF